MYVFFGDFTCREEQGAGFSLCWSQFQSASRRRYERMVHASPREW